MLRILSTIALVLAASCGRIGFSGDDGAGDDDPVGEGRWAQVALGDRSSCGLTTTGELWCWGYGVDGTLGIGSTPPVATPTRVGADVGWTAVEVGRAHACGLRAGELWCWGSNQAGALGTGPLDSIAVNPIHVVGATWTDVDVGDLVTCGVQSDQSLWCWGANWAGQTGLGHAMPVLQPTRVGTASWRSISVGTATVCGVQTDDSIWCWGDNPRGSVGDGTRGTPRLAPVAIAPGRAWREVETSWYHTCGIDSAGGGWCWGMNDDGRLGTGSNIESFVPVPIAGPPIASIALGLRHSCALTADDRAICWGASVRGAIPSVPALGITNPTEIDRGVGLVVEAGGLTTCTIDDTARMRCSGANGAGQSGAAPGEVHALTQADTRTDWVRLYADRTHSCGETTDGALWCWGLGGYGQVGDSTRLDRQVPVEVGTGFTDVEVGTYGTAALRGTELWGWGVDVGGSGEYPTPTLFGPGFMDVAVGEYHACGLETDGRLVCNGANRYGQLGGGTFEELPNTVVAGIWRTVWSSSIATCATRPGGGLTDRLFCWGVSHMVGSGQTDDLPAPLPVALPLDREVHHVSLGFDYACALIGTGEIWCWGYNYTGQLGITGVNENRMPVQVGSRGDWLAVDAGSGHACAIAADRSLWCWGRAEQGEIGEPLMRQRAPAQIGTGTDWAALALGDRFTCALKQNGTRWCMGVNDQGELGDGHAWLTELTAVP